MNFYNNFVRLCNSVGKSPSRVVLDVGATKSAITRWKNGGNPTDATAMKLAEYFGVSVQELMGEGTFGEMAYEIARDQGLVESPFKQKEKPTVTMDDGLSDSKRKLIDLAKDLPEDQAELLLRQAELFLQMMDVKAGGEMR